MDEFYPKRKGGAGHHGGEYQLKVIMLFLLKAFEDKRDFKLSSENLNESALDDAVLLDDDKNILASVKHSENGNGKIHMEPIFSETHNYSILIPLESYKQKYLKHLEDLNKNIQKLHINDTYIKTLKECAKTAVEDFKANTSNYEKKFKQLSEKIYEIKDKTLITKIEWFENILPYLIVNIEPHLQVKRELVSEKQLNEDDFLFTKGRAVYYTFKPEEILAKIRSICASGIQVKLSDFFVTQFCRKFKLVILENEILEKNIESKLRNLDLFKKSHIDFETAYNHFFNKIKDWYNYYKSGDGYLLTRFHVEVMFSDLWSKVYVRQLKTLANKFHFEVESLAKKIDEKTVTLVNSPRYLLLMVKLQEKWYKKVEKEKIIFINPNDNIGLQKCSIKSFLYDKYTHLVCPLLVDKNDELVSDVNNILPNLRHYKKIVLIAEFDLNIQHPSTHVISDQELYGNFVFRDIPRVKSMGDMDKYYVPRYFVPENEKSFSEETFLNTVIDSNKKFILIIDGPGAGKTTLLTNLTCKINQRDDLCAVNIQLGQFTNVLKEGLKKNNLQLEDFLPCTSTIEDTVERQIYTIPEIIYLTIDAVDEIAPKYTQLVLTFLQNVSNRVAKIIVSSRDHLKTDLSVFLNVTPYSLKPFTSKEQKKFIINYWISNLGLKNEDGIEKYENYCDLLLERLEQFRTFLDMPLQTKMIAEIFLKGVGSEFTGCQQYLENNEDIIVLPHDISLTRLYELFVDRRKEIYLESCNIQGNVAAEQALMKEFNSYITLCEEISVRIHFSKKYWNLFSLKEDDLSKYDDILYYKIGLLILPSENWWSDTRDSSSEESDTGHIIQGPQFIHRSFGEYFAARIICRKLFDHANAKPKFTKLILNILLKDEYDNVRRFFESTLANNYEKNSAEIERQFQEVLQNTIYTANTNLNMLPYRSFLHNLNVFLGSTDRPKEWIINRYGMYITINIEGRFSITFTIKKDNLLASSIKYLYILKLLIADGTEINLRRLLDETVLHCAAGLGYIYSASVRIAEEIDDIYLDPTFKLYSSLPEEISYNYHTEVVKLLVEKGASVTKRSASGWTSLHYATKSKNLKLIKFLISKGADVNEQTTFLPAGQTPFHIAFKGRCFEICEYLLTVQSINVNIKDNKGRGLWSYALDTSKDEGFDFINKIRECYNINVETDSEALCITVEKNNSTRLQRLLDFGFDINSKNRERWNPLLVSVRKRNKYMFTFLIGKGADAKATTEDGSTILHVAAYFTGDVEMFMLAEKQFDDIYSKNVEGQTVLHNAAQYGNLQLVVYICQKSKTLPFENSLDGRTCLHYAVYSNCLETVEYLVEKVGIRLDAQAKNGETALHVAVQRGHLDIVQFMVDKMKNEKIDLNFRIKESFVLFVPSYKFRNEITQILLESGVNESIIKHT